MKVRDVMTSDPVSCSPSDIAQNVARTLRDNDIGSVPVLGDDGKLIGIITDRDLCCSILANGLDPNTTIADYITLNPITCRADDDVDDCERAMQQHQIRRIPVVDDQKRCLGVVSQADLALHDEAKKVSKTVAEISKPTHHEPSARKTA